MKNYNNKLFIGNIMQRTEFEGKRGPCSSETITKSWMRKENAVLYKTKNNGYVDVSSLNLGSIGSILKIRKIEKVAIDHTSKEISSDLVVMPAISLNIVSKPTKEYGIDGVLGQFVDINTLRPYVMSEEKDMKVYNISRRIR